MRDLLCFWDQSWVDWVPFVHISCAPALFPPKKPWILWLGNLKDSLRDSPRFTPKVRSLLAGKLSSQPHSVLVSNASSSHAPGQYLCPGGNYSPSEKQPRIIYLHDSCGGSVGDLNNLRLQQLQMNHQKPFCVPVFSSTQKVSSPQAIGWIPYPN